MLPKGLLLPPNTKHLSHPLVLEQLPLLPAALTRSVAATPLNVATLPCLQHQPVLAAINSHTEPWAAKAVSLTLLAASPRL
jgi:hypothetical protein